MTSDAQQKDWTRQKEAINMLSDVASFPIPPERLEIRLFQRPLFMSQEWYDLGLQIIIFSVWSFSCFPFKCPSLSDWFELKTKIWVYYTLFLVLGGGKKALPHFSNPLVKWFSNFLVSGPLHTLQNKWGPQRALVDLRWYEYLLHQKSKMKNSKILH